ncbi:MAG: hypothetical protein WBW49_25160 [Candidatus Acidiferrum sp.]
MTLRAGEVFGYGCVWVIRGAGSYVSHIVFSSYFRGTASMIFSHTDGPAPYR